MMKYLPISFTLLTLLLFACGGGSNKPSNEVRSSLDSTSESSSPTSSTTQITWLEESYDFGKVKEGKQVTYSYRFVNSGDKPLLISDASAQCGCTVPEWPKELIAVGDTSEIIVNFDSQNRTGVQNKEISITANTDPNLSTLRLRGEVTKVNPNFLNYALPFTTSFFRGGYTGLIFMVLMLVVLYMFMIRPQQKRQRRQKEYISSLKVGDNIVSIGGLHGKLSLSPKTQWS